MTPSGTALSLSLLEALPDPCLLVDPAGGWRVRRGNPAAARCLGQDTLGLRGRALTDLLPELGAHLPELGRLGREGGAGTWQFRAAGPWPWVGVRAYPVGDLVAVQFFDVTAHRLAEERAAALFELTVALSRVLTVGEAADVVLRRGLSALGGVTGTVYVLDPRAGDLMLAGAQGYGGAYMEGWRRCPLDVPTLLGDALGSGRPLFLDTAEVDARYPHLRVERTVPTRSVAALPLGFGGRPVGVLSLGFAGDQAHAAPEQRFMLALAEGLAQALERAHLFAGERRARSRAALLYAVTSALGAARTPAEVAREVLEASTRALGAAGGAVLGPGAGCGAPVLLGESGDGETGEGGFGGWLGPLAAECARTGQAAFLGAPAYRERHPDGGGRVQTAAALPLVVGGGTVGVLAYGWDEAHAFGHDQRDLLGALAGQCAQALERTLLAGAERAQAQLLDLAQDAVIVRTPASEVTYWNPAAGALYGFAPAEALGRVTHDLLHTRFPGTREALEAALLAGDVWEGELVHTARDGREVTVASRQTMRRDERGAPAAILEVNRDVTAERAAAHRLAASEERHRALIEATHQYVWTTSPGGEMVGEQPGWARLTGQTPQESRGHGWAERLHPGDRGPALAAWREALRTGSTYAAEQRVRVRDGSYRSFLVRAVPLEGEHGEVREWVGLHTDVTDLKRAEQTLQAWGSELERQVEARTAELRAANEELGAFASTVSHDLRAPVRHVSSFASLLRRKVGDNPGALRYVDLIEGAARRMEALTDALLGLARTGTAELSRAEVDLGPLVEAVRSDLAPDLAGRRVTWRVGELPPVHADPELLRQVLTNLLGNAVKYSRGREGALIEVGAEEAGGEVIVAVRDNGTGFDPRHAARLFGVFQRLHPEEFEGTGVGLANVKRIVEKHGGRVWAEGRPGEGATFFFSLPRADRAEVLGWPPVGAAGS